LKAEFVLKQADIIQQLTESKSLIHLSFDLWTSPQKTMAVISIVAHFLRPDYTNQSVLLSLQKVEGTHSGENQAEHILNTLRTFNIKRLGYFVCDNHGSNDTAIRAILQEYGIPEQEERRRLRCLGHIINLAAQAFLFGRQTEAFENNDLADLEAAYRLWQEAGPVGQVHYIVAFIRASTERRGDFSRLQGDIRTLQPLLDNKTRWNSTFTMLRRAKQLRRPIHLFCIQYVESKDLDPSVMISDETWELVGQICEILELFDYATEKLQGVAKEALHGSLWECLPMIEVLLSEVEQLKAQYPVTEEQITVSVPSSRRGKASQSTSSQQPQTASTADSFITIGLNNAW
jgi:hypothetical protein